MRGKQLIYLVIMLSVSTYNMADTLCSTVIRSNDQIEWDHSSIKIDKQCQEYTITLIHQGHLDKSVMGHSWVLTTSENKQEIIKKLTLSKNSDYVKDDPKIIAYTPLIGGGETTSITFETNKLEANQPYVYFCSYPEHADLMWGELTLVDE